MSVLEFIIININLIVFYLLFRLISKGISHKVFNRFYLLITPIIAIGLPFIGSHESFSTPFLSEQLPLVSTLQKIDFIGIGRATDWNLNIYSVGIAASILLALIQFIRILRQPKAEFTKNENGINMYSLKGNQSTYSFFNRIYLNNNHGDSEAMVVLHEQAHCKELHTIDLLVMVIYKSIFWFNPVVYFWNKSMKENHEYIADAYVLQNEVNAKEYGVALLDATLFDRAPLLSNSFSTKSTVRKRIENLNNKNKYNMKHLMLVPVMAGLTFLSTAMMDTNNDRITKSLEIVQGENDRTAQFVGGMDGLIAYMQDNLKYPKDASEKNIQGTVYLKFTVEATGAISSPIILRGAGNDKLDAAALEFINGMPNWEPAISNGKNIASEMTLPINFAL